MSHVETRQRVHEMLAAQAADLADIEDEYGDINEMTNPVLTEWVLVANVVDLDGNGEDDVRLTLVCAPNMLRSHVVGLLTMARAL